MDPVSPEKFSNLQVEVASLPRYEEAELSSLDRKYLLKLHIRTTISLLFFTAGLVAGYFFLQNNLNYFVGGFVLLLVLFGWSYYVNFQLMKRNGYALRQLDIIFRSGYLFEKTTVVPFNRVQHVSVERSFTDKLLKLSTLKIYTAGGAGSDISIPGLLPQTATSLKEEISVRIADHV
ncbi:PH domain-containing protein [Salinimicrobium flavum]|uniref:PH domain-containing protein n=1 Tax=Salinimicrobium flavum TaxID=1737065 RepID=A0ABW5J067_9FLAO